MEMTAMLGSHDCLSGITQPGLLEERQSAAACTLSVVPECLAIGWWLWWRCQPKGMARCLEFMS
jgi:hypothetical protein